MTNKVKPLDFEASLKELEGIVNKMEQSELSLEEALKQFERGVKLTQGCQTALKKAEQKVTNVSQNLQITVDE